MRDDYLQNARLVIEDPYVLVNVVSRRVKQLRRGARPLVTSLEKMGFDDIALREISEGRISFAYSDDTVEDIPGAPIHTHLDPRAKL